jgi:hypothetical protein
VYFPLEWFDETMGDCRLGFGASYERCACKKASPRHNWPSAWVCRSPYVSKYESGERRLDLIEIRNICVALGT